MTVYRLLWRLARLVLAGHGRDLCVVTVAVEQPTVQRVLVRSEYLLEEVRVADANLVFVGR